MLSRVVFRVAHILPSSSSADFSEDDEHSGNEWRSDESVSSTGAVRGSDIERDEKQVEFFAKRVNARNPFL